MPVTLSLILTALMNGSAMALPNDFAGLKLGQNREQSTKFLLDKGFNIIHPDGKITHSPKPALNQLCTVAVEPLLPKANLPAIQTFTCGVVKAKSPNNFDRVIDTYIIHHFLHEKGDDQAFSITFMFNLKTTKPAGSGVLGKLGEPDTVTADQACPAFVRTDLKLKGREIGHGCYMAVWLPDGSEFMASVLGYGKNLTGSGSKVARLEMWNMQVQKKVEEHKATKAAHELGF